MEDRVTPQPHPLTNRHPISPAIENAWTKLLQPQNRVIRSPFGLPCHARVDHFANYNGMIPSLDGFDHAAFHEGWQGGQNGRARSADAIGLPTDLLAIAFDRFEKLVCDPLLPLAQEVQGETPRGADDGLRMGIGLDSHHYKRRLEGS